MDRLPDREANRPRRGRHLRPQFGAVIWIAILLISWLVIVEWKMLPELMNATLAALS